MEIIPQLIKTYSIVLYAVCGIACSYFLLTGIASFRELRRAVFRLERRAVVSRAVNALLKAVLCVIIGGGIYLVTTMAPISKANALLGSVTSTPVGIVIPTSMPTAAIQSGQVQAAANLTFTATISDPKRVLTTTVATIAPGLIPDCSNANAQIISPAQAEKISGNVAIKGTAVLAAGDWYKLEIQTPGAIAWTQVGRGEATVISGVLLTTFGASGFAPGVYPFRLLIMGSDGAVRAVCRMPITIGK